MTSTKESSDGQSNELLAFLGLVFLVVPHALLWFFVSTKVIQKIGKNWWVVLGSFLVSTLTLIYFSSVFSNDVRLIFSNIQLVFEGNENLFLFFLKIPLGYSLTSQILICSVTFTISILISLFSNNDLEIDSLNQTVRQVRKERKNNMDNRFSVVQNRKNETVIGFKIGKRVVTAKDDLRHFFVCGTTGSGKTVTLSNFMESAINKGYPLFLIDGKGDTGENSMLDLVQKMKGDRKLYVISMLDPVNSDKYNPFKSASPSVIADMLINLSDWSEEHYKANTTRYLNALLRLLQIGGLNLTFPTILDYLGTDKLFYFLNDMFNEELITKTEYDRYKGIFEGGKKIVREAASRFFNIFESDVGEIFGDDGTDIYSAIEEDAIILFILNPLLYPETTALLGRLLLIDSKVAVNFLYTNEKERVFYIMDEINTYASRNLTDLLNKSGSANVTCIVATQSLSDLDEASGPAFKEQVIENCNNYIVMRQNSGINAEAWAKVFGTKEALAVTYQIGDEDNKTVATGKGTVKKDREFIFHPDDIKNLKTGEAFYVSRDTGEKSKIQVRKGF